MSYSSPLRIISLLPSATEIVVALGLEDALVGRSHECDYPPQIQELPVCTLAQLNTTASSSQIDQSVKALVESAISIYQLKLDIIKNLQPTHIITQDQCDVCAVSFPMVEQAVNQYFEAPPTLISLKPNRLNQVWQSIEQAAMGLGVASKEVIGSIKAKITAINDKTQTIDPKPTVVALEWLDPLMAAGTWIPELIEQAGGQALLSRSGHPSSYISFDQLQDANPDLIILMPCCFDLQRTQLEALALTEKPEWSSLDAVQNGQTYITDGNAYFNRPSQRLLNSLEILTEIFHPESFPRSYSQQVWQKLS
ncbi:MAG: cobalamin-binding protein [Microcystaceae cyanobacterium]